MLMIVIIFIVVLMLMLIIVIVAVFIRSLTSFLGGLPLGYPFLGSCHWEVDRHPFSCNLTTSVVMMMVILMTIKMNLVLGSISIWMILMKMSL